MPNYGFQITVKVNDQGKQRYSTSQECMSQAEMQRAAAYAVSQALGACFNSPPTIANMILAMEDDSGPIHALGVADGFWDGYSNFEDAITIVVDIDELMHDSEPKEKDHAELVLGQYRGVRIKRKAPIEPEGSVG